MPFQDDFVLLDTLDTVLWKMLPWQSKALLPLILRKVDKVGMVDIGNDGLPGIAALTDMPIELVKAAMPELLRRRVVNIACGKLIVSNFVTSKKVSQ